MRNAAIIGRPVLTRFPLIGYLVSVRAALSTVISGPNRGRQVTAPAMPDPRCPPRRTVVAQWKSSLRQQREALSCPRCGCSTSACAVFRRTNLPLSGHCSSRRYPQCHSVVRHYLLATGGMQWALRGTSVVLEVWQWLWGWARRFSQGTESPGQTPQQADPHRRDRRHPPALHPLEGVLQAAGRPAPNRHEPRRAHHPAQVPVQDLYLATPRRRTGRTEG